MDTPYNLIFGQDELLSDTAIRTLPDWCYHPITFAGERRYYRLPEAEILSQRVNQRPFYIDLVQVRARRPKRIRFSLPRRQLFLYVMLEGGLLLTTPENCPITRTRNNTFLLLYYNKGEYMVQVGTGHHTALIVTFAPEWLARAGRDFPNILPVFERFRSSDTPYEIMHPQPIGRRVHRWLNNIFSYSENNISALDGNLRKYFSYILAHYDTTLGVQSHDLAYRVRVYLNEHYRDATLSNQYLAAHFHVTARTLRNHFKREYGTTPHEYYSRLRITDAIMQMERNDLNASDVYLSVGYSDESSFRYALNRFLKRQ
ncbi:helix-turn-helix domain-containing protein [Sinomicrobium soli]|uniref:helix-turn-helix domain-containing protein n=1 Tax=Sinomicrobium sp. N-1-3-6 TaxID=2219864 RepID=UPI000DCDEDB1|nr:AraC family transcriptional regulator [Sinomicrobium sp. N-1-3-6]RAV27552.1 AraC family transcriptional regulator [Sinomicrobium sp. N-1-3-6]